MGSCDTNSDCSNNVASDSQGENDMEVSSSQAEQVHRGIKRTRSDEDDSSDEGSYSHNNSGRQQRPSL